ncbi:hypothetical protein ACFL6S_09310 [Candidatus Poribacteria bacterium]
MKIAVRNGSDGEWKRMSVSNQQADDSLHDLIRQMPEFISIEDLEPEGASMKLCIEHSSANDAEDDGGLIGIDDNGRITIVECRVANDSSIRREILGQALEYAANLWQMPYEEFDDMVVRSEGSSLVELMSERIPAKEWSEEAFRDAITDTLNRGNFRLIMAIQEMTDKLKQVIKFLSARGALSFETYALEIQRFCEGEVEIAVPKLTSFAELGQESYIERTAPIREAAPPQPPEQEHPQQERSQAATSDEPVIGSSEESTESTESSDSPELVIGNAKPPERKDKRKEALFFAKCQETASQNVVETIRKLYVFSMESADNIMWWGSGGAGAFNFALTEDQLTVFIVDATGRIMFNFSEWQREPVYKMVLFHQLSWFRRTSI